MIRFWKKLLIVQQPFWPNDDVLSYIFISLLRNLLCINDTGTIYSTTPNLVAGCQAVRTHNMGQNFDGFVTKLQIYAKVHTNEPNPNKLLVLPI